MGTTPAWRCSLSQIGLFVLFAVTGEASAQERQAMRFKNNMLPGQMTFHRISRTIERVSPRQDYEETLVYRQEADWIQCNLEEPKPGRVMFFDMLRDRPAEVVSLFRGAEQIRALPAASEFNLPNGSTRLYSATRTDRDSPVRVPLTEEAQRAVLMTMLDVAHWQAGPAEPGRRWQREIKSDLFVGKQTFEFIDLVRAENGEMAGRLTLFVEGEFGGSLGRACRFGKGRAEIVWLRADRSLLQLRGKADYERLRPDGNDRYKLNLDVVLRDTRSLDDERQDDMRDQLILFDQALRHQREGHDREALDLCAEFRGKWPKSVWMPAVDELELRAGRTKDDAGGSRLSPDALLSNLAKSVIAWEAYSTNREYDRLDQTRKALEKLVKDDRVRIVKLAGETGELVRGRALFALAFSARGEDFAAVQRGVRDKSSKVRALALMGLAARADSATSVELLLGALDDRKASVRMRACDAVATCVEPEHFSAGAVAERLVKMVAKEKGRGVRRAAARAMAAVGATADLSALESAKRDEKDTRVRREIERAIEAITRRAN